MVTLDDVEVIVSRVCDHLPRGVRKRHGVLFKLCPEVRDLEDTKIGMSRRSSKTRRRIWVVRKGSVGTIGNNKEKISSCPNAVRTLVLITDKPQEERGAGKRLTEERSRRCQ